MGDHDPFGKGKVKKERPELRTRDAPLGIGLESPIVKHLSQFCDCRDQSYTALNKMYDGRGFLFPARLPEFFLPLTNQCFPLPPGTNTV